MPPMSHPRPFRFGIQLHTAPDGPSWAASARKAEDLGFSTLFLPDHFGDQLAPIPALMAAADATTTLRVGSLVFDNDYKHPLVLAKELATIDRLSGGRLEVGLGAGWMATDYEESGIPMDSPGVRVSRMVEGIEVIKGCFGPGPFSFKGEHYTITEHDAQPSRCSRHRRSSSGEAPSACCRSRAGKRRSSASTRRSTAAVSTPPPPRTAPPM